MFTEQLLKTIVGSISYSDSDNKWHATMNATANQLEAAPERE
jgi:hypothetical protein